MPVLNCFKVMPLIELSARMRLLLRSASGIGAQSISPRSRAGFLVRDKAVADLHLTSLIAQNQAFHRLVCDRTSSRPAPAGNILDHIAVCEGVGFELL
jgi:hypothetical protein